MKCAKQSEAKQAETAEKDIELAAAQKEAELASAREMAAMSTIQFKVDLAMSQMLRQTDAEKLKLELEKKELELRG